MEYSFSIIEKVRCIYGEDVITPKCRAQFVHLVTPNTPRGFENSRKKYRIVLCQPKNLEGGEKELRKKHLEMCNAMFMQLTEALHALDTKAKKTKLSLADYRKEYQQKMKYAPYRDGDTSGDYDGYAGCELIHANAAGEDKEGRVIDPTDAIVFLDGIIPQDIKAGMLVRAQIQPCLGEQGFSYTLRRIRLLADDGTRYSSGGGTDLLSGADDAAQIKASLGAAQTALSDTFDTAVGKEVTPTPEPEVNDSGLEGVFG